MSIRKCSPSEALKAAQKYGCNDEHAFKKHIVGSYNSVSNSDIFIESSTGEIFIGDKNETNLQETGVRI